MRRDLPSWTWAGPALAGTIAGVVLVTGWVYPLLLPLLVALAVCGAQGHRALALPAVLLALAAPAPWVSTADRAILLGMLCCASWAGAWLAALTRRRSREQVQALIASSSARAVAEERLRIARDLHDMVAHSISVITVHAALGAHAGPGQARRAVEALQVVEDTGRQTLNQLRELLAVLRTERLGTDGAAPLAPAPTIADLPELLAMTRAAGVQLEVRQDGDLDTVPPEVGLCLYRIIQEGLANALKHGHPGTTSLVLARDHTGIQLELSNPIPPTAKPTKNAPPAQQGNGLIGIRERATLLDGTADAGIAADRYLLSVWLPLPAQTPAQTCAQTTMARP
jgi:signal transduction histidine kinase